jgi:hypothetical protein
MEAAAVTSIIAVVAPFYKLHRIVPIGTQALLKTQTNL